MQSSADSGARVLALPSSASFSPRTLLPAPLVPFLPLSLPSFWHPVSHSVRPEAMPSESEGGGGLLPLCPCRLHGPPFI